MKRHLTIGFVLVTLFLILAIPISSWPSGNVYVFALPRGLPRYIPKDITIQAHCLTEDADTRVRIAMDGSNSYMTPLIFPLGGTHTFTVPETDSRNHQFVAWSTGETTTTITISSAGTYIAFYGVSTYDVTVDASYNVAGNVNVSITEDGVPTGFDAPHTFTGLTGTHNFTVPSTDASGHSFVRWSKPSGPFAMSTTITVSSGGTYTANYDIGLCQFVTPSDPAVVAAAGNRSWGEMLDYVSSNISYGNSIAWQFPNETLSLGSGQCKEYSTLLVSMLLTRGYTAYVVVGNANSYKYSENHAWVVIDFNGTLVHVEPQQALYNQQFVNFTVYHAESYFDEKGIYQPISSEDPVSLVTQPITQPDTLKVPSVFSVLTLILIIAAIACWVTFALFFSFCRKIQKRSSTSKEVDKS